MIEINKHRGINLKLFTLTILAHNQCSKVQEKHSKVHLKHKNINIIPTTDLIEREMHSNRTTTNQQEKVMLDSHQFLSTNPGSPSPQPQSPNEEAFLLGRLSLASTNLFSMVSNEHNAGDDIIQIHRRQSKPGTILIQNYMANQNQRSENEEEEEKIEQKREEETKVNNEGDHLNAASDPVEHPQEHHSNRNPTEEAHNILEIQENLNPPPIQNQNQSPIQDNTNTIPSPQATQPIQPNANRVLSRIQEFARPEANIFLTKISTFSSFIILISTFFLLEISPDMTLSIMFAAFSSLATIDLFWKYRVLTEDVTSQLGAYNGLYITVDTLAGGWVMLLFYLRLKNAFDSAIFIPALFLLTLALYAWRSRVTGKKRRWNLLIKLFYCLQTLLVSLKVDGILNWDWKFILLLSWIYLAGQFLKYILFTLDLYEKMIQTSAAPRNLPKSTKIIVFLWHFNIYGIIALAIFALFPLTEAFNLRKFDTSMIRIMASLSIIMNCLLLFSTWLFWKRIVEFLIVFRVIPSYLMMYHIRQARNKVRQVNFDVEDKKSYFVMLSSTYFLPLRESFFTKGKENLNKFRTMIKDLKLGKSKPRNLTRSSNLPITERTEEIKSFHQFKEKLDQKLSKANSPLKLSPSRDFKQKISDNIHNTSVLHSERENIFKEEIDNLHIKPAISVQDLHNFHHDEMPEKVLEDQEPCYICCLNPPDAIFMNCGHGGICYDCAISTAKARDNCIECRKKIESIYQIDNSIKLSNAVKGTKRTKLTIKLI